MEIPGGLTGSRWRMSRRAYGAEEVHDVHFLHSAKGLAHAYYTTLSYIIKPNTSLLRIMSHMSTVSLQTHVIVLVANC
ncbi:hypothetical protein BD311DRAFT_765766, partial [Dichomitus squalens]